MATAEHGIELKRAEQFAGRAPTRLPEERFVRGQLCQMDPDEHLVEFYDSDAGLVGSVCDYVGSALRQGDAAIVVATEGHLALFEQELPGTGVDLAAARLAGRYVPLDARLRHAGSRSSAATR